jgi:glucosamine 6-phosphate synthetase-like amidotransferase/phosphosugar isomerase protein
VWIFGPPPAGLVDDVLRTGAQVEVSAVDPLVDLVRVQRMAVALAEARGLDPDRPRHLARSIILR